VGTWKRNETLVSHGVASAHERVKATISILLLLPYSLDIRSILIPLQSFMSALTNPSQFAADFSDRLVTSALDLIRQRLLQLRPSHDSEYSQFTEQIKPDLQAFIFAAASASHHAPATGGALSAIAQPPGYCDPAVSHSPPSSNAVAPTASPATPTPAAFDSGKFDTFVMPSGTIEDYYKGLSSRLGFPHLQFFKTMEAEHTSMPACDMPFTTRNYGITTTAQAEWDIVVRGNVPPPEHMLHGRVVARVEEKMQCAEARKAGLRMEEVVAVILYSGPMYMLYNCVLAQWSSPPALWDTLRSGNNLFTTTLCVLVSAVQKLSAFTVIPDGLRLYRGTGGLARLPSHFTQPDEHNCRGMTEWGFLSSSTNKSVALDYSGVLQGRPHAIVLEIQPSCADRGAVVSQFSQYPGEGETLFLPMSYVAQSGQQRIEHTATGQVTIVPVRVNVNLKAERLEQLEEKKKAIHLTGFEFRVGELRQKLQQVALAGDADARLKRDKVRQETHWKKPHTVEGYIDAQVKKVEAVLARHRALAAADYSDDALYRGLVAESLDAARMAESALQWWMRDEGQPIAGIEDDPLLDCQRRFESFLSLQFSNAADLRGRRAAAVDLSIARSLLRADANEVDENGEARLIALVARGGSTGDIKLLVAAGANVGACNSRGRSAMYFAAQQGYAEAIEALARADADCNQADSGGSTPMWIASLNGHANCVDALILLKADADKARTDTGSSPLIMASQKGHAGVVHLLLRGRADANKAKTDNGTTPLIVASEYGHSSIVAALLGCNADVNTARADGATALSICIEKGHKACAEVLMRAQSDVYWAQQGQAQQVSDSK